LLDLDPEFVHDLRVATRRARFALRLLDVDDQTSWAAHVREELSWIAASLGAVRDLDVFLLRLPELYARAEAPAAVRAFVTRQFRSSRAVALRELVAALSSKRFHQLLADLQSAMTTERISLPPEAAESSALDLSGRSINQAARRVRRWTPIRPESAANLHRLRIAFKRLRYTCEFFADLYLDGLQPFIRRFVKMQDLLGRHQDAVVAAENFRRLAATVASAAQPATERLVFLGALIQLQREEMNDAQVRLDARWKRNRKQIKKLLRFVEQTGPEKENEEPPGDKDH
jgi:CHAD domain-containing protein